MYKQDTFSAPMILNTVVATVLGLHRNTSKKPPFIPSTVWYTRLHELLTMDTIDQTAWIDTHMPLCLLSFCEYLCKVIPICFPCEYEALLQHFAMHPFFHDSCHFFDMFRQMIHPDQSWETILHKAQEVYEKLHRLYKAKCRSRRTVLFKHSQNQQSTPNLSSAQEIIDQLTQPMIRLYPIHYLFPKQLKTEYASLQCPIQNTCLLHFISVHPLPGDIQAEQLAIAEAQASLCQRRAYMKRTLFLCLLCEYRHKHSVLRYSVHSTQLVCEECQSDACVVGIDTVGRVVRVNQRQFIYTLCCGTVGLYCGRMQHWTANGNRKTLDHEKRYNTVFPESIPQSLLQIVPRKMGLHVPICNHLQKKQKEKKEHSKKCSYCKLASTGEPTEVFDTKSRGMKTVYCCMKHGRKKPFVSSV